MDLMKANKRSRTLVPTRGKELLPGIHDDITLAQITTKMSWRDICLMSSVSHGWQQAIQNRTVYNARVLRNSTETLVVVLHNASTSFRVFYDISFYSMRDKSYQTHPFEPRRAQKLVTLDGKVYTFREDFKQLYMLDLAAGRCQWKPCGGYHELPEWYEFGVMDGKIYAFISSRCEPGPSIFGLEVFDPKQNTWSLTKLTKMPGRVQFQVARVGNEFAVYGGSSMEVLNFYHPHKDEWRVMKSFCRPEEKLLVVGDRFYSMSPSDIHVYDIQGNSWAHLHSYSFPAFNPSVEPATLQVLGTEVYCVDVTLIAVVNNELLAYWKWFDGSRPEQWKSWLLQSRGFASQSEQLVWKKADFSVFLDQKLLLFTTPRSGSIQIESIQL